MKIELLDHPDRDGATIYRFAARKGYRIELWPITSGRDGGLYQVWKIPAWARFSSNPGPRDEHFTIEKPVPLCTAQLMALKILGVEPERSVPHSGSDGDREIGT